MATLVFTFEDSQGKLKSIRLANFNSSITPNAAARFMARMVNVGLVRKGNLIYHTSAISAKLTDSSDNVLFDNK